jgi:hypothetical protein
MGAGGYVSDVPIKEYVKEKIDDLRADLDKRVEALNQAHRGQSFFWSLIISALALIVSLLAFLKKP